MWWLIKIIVGILATQSTASSPKASDEKDLLVHFTPDQIDSLRAHSGFNFNEYSTEIDLSSSLPPNYAYLMPELESFSSSKPQGLSTAELKGILDEVEISDFDVHNPEHIRKITPYIVAHNPGEYWGELSSEDTRTAIFTLARSHELANKQKSFERKLFDTTTKHPLLKFLSPLNDFFFHPRKISVDIVRHTPHFWLTEDSISFDETLLDKTAKREVKIIREAHQRETTATIKGSLNQLYELMDELLSAPEIIDIDEFENVPKVGQLHQELEALKTRHTNGEELSNEIRQKNRQLRSELRQAHAERKRFTQTLNQAERSLTGAIKIISLWDSEFANELAVISSSSLKAVEQGAALLGAGLAAGSVDPLYAIGTIGEAIVNVINFFKNKPKASNPNVIILGAINKLFEQMQQLRREMHATFSAISTQIDLRAWQALMEINDIKSYQIDTLSLLYLMDKKISHYMDRDTHLAGISDRLSRITENLMLINYHGHMSELKKQLRHIAQNSKFPNYSELLSLLDSLGLDNAQSDQLESIIMLPEDAEPANYFLLNSHFAQLGAAAKNETIMEINGKINPLQALYACAAKLLLSYKQYPIHNSTYMSERITRSEIAQLKVYAVIFESIVRLIHATRSPVVIKNLISRYFNATKKLAEQIEIKNYEIESSYTLTKQSERNALLLETRADEIDLFKREFNIGTYGWFEGMIYYDKRLHAGKRYFVAREEDKLNPYNEPESKKAYVDERKKLIEKMRLHFLDAMKIHQRLANKNHLSAFNTSLLSPYHGAALLKPTQPNLPYLAAPDPFLASNHSQAEVMLALLEAQALGLGSIEFFYDIKREEKLYSIEIKFHPKPSRTSPITEKIDVATVALAFEALFYEGEEAVWIDWHGITDLIINSTEKIWFDPCCDQKVTTFIDALHGGGRGHKNGEFEYRKYVMKIPANRANHEAKLDYFNSTNAAKINLVVNSTALTQIRLATHEMYEEFQLYHREKLKEQLDYHLSTPLGKACLDFEESYRNLFGLMSYAYFDEMQNTNSALRQWFFQKASNIKRLKKIFSDKHPQLAMRKLIAASSTIYDAIPIIPPHSVHFAILEELQSALQSFLLLYEPYATEDVPIAFDATVMEVLAKLNAVFLNGVLNFWPPEESFKAVTAALEEYDGRVREEVMKRIGHQWEMINHGLPSPIETKMLPDTDSTTLRQKRSFTMAGTGLFSKGQARISDTAAPEDSDSTLETETSIQPSTP